VIRAQKESGDMQTDGQKYILTGFPDKNKNLNIITSKKLKLILTKSINHQKQNKGMQVE
jgi:hypothetical protein